MDSLTVKDIVEGRNIDEIEEEVNMTLYSLKAKGIIDFRLDADNNIVDVEFLIDPEILFGKLTHH